jgi:DNA-binding CsgD family transcriptional regulator
MFDLQIPLAGPSATRVYNGPERRNAASLAWRWLAAALDEIDYGVLLVDDELQLLHVNHAARRELDEAHPLMLQGRSLQPRHPRDLPDLQHALDGSLRGLRRMIAIGDEGHEVTISVVPLPTIGADARRATLVMLGRREVCGELAVQGFARTHGLTPGETRVLAALCRGVPPTTIAGHHGVAISTVRSQIGSIRGKTGASSIRELVRQAAALPPLMTVLRGLPASNDGSALIA